MSIDARADYMPGFLEGFWDGFEDGRQYGITQGEDKACKLIELLIRDKRNNEIEKITKDEEYREKLYEEYGL